MKQSVILAAVIAMVALPGMAAKLDDCGCECEMEAEVEVREISREGAPDTEEAKPALTFDMTKCDADGACAVINPNTREVLYMTRPDPSVQR